MWRPHLRRWLQAEPKTEPDPLPLDGSGHKGPFCSNRLLVFNSQPALGNASAALPARGEGPAGIAAADLTEDPKKRLVTLLDTYFQNVAPALAVRPKARMEAAGINSVHFAWAGAITPRPEIYYRVHGPTLLIEFDNTTDDAEHIHTLWRDPRNDFGRGLLRQHYESGHHSQ